MFCKIRKGKNTYSIYLCDRKRVDGKVVSKDIKISSFAWHSLFEIDEEYEGLKKDIPDILYDFLSRVILGKYDLDIFESVVTKLIEVKKEYYTTYKELSEKWNKEREKESQKKAMEYEEFKERFRTLHYNEIMTKYKEGYDNGLLDGVLKSKEFKNKCSVKSNDINNEEMKLLKEAFKMLAMKHHPDKGGNTEKMAMINNLKEKIL